MAWRLGCARCRTAIPEGRTGRYCSGKCEAIASRQRTIDGNRLMVKACTEWIAAETVTLESYIKFLEGRNLA